MPKILLILISFLVFHSPLYSQNQANHWCFGNYAHIQFSNGNPVNVTPNASILTREGNGTISDVNGNLLFYTDGSTVWNANNAVMPNGTGLLGDNSSTESAMIIQMPGSSTLYYIFTVPGQSNSYNGLRYSIVDMSLNGGLGAVTSTKNVLLLANACERVTACKHANGTSFWIISKVASNALFYSFLLSPTGVNTTPVISSGIDPQNVGYIKMNAQGNKLVQVNHYNPASVELYNFNNNTGALTNGFTLPLTDNLAYGGEFSPNGSRLYVTANYNMYQYNLNAGTNAAIIASKTAINTVNNIQHWGLQIAPNGKIYVSYDFTNYIGVINNPDNLGIACGHVHNAHQLATNALSRLGFPVYISNIFNPVQVSASYSCLSDTTFFTTSNSSSLDSIKWDFDDTLSGASNYSTAMNPFHIFLSSGLHNVQFITYQNGFIDTNYISVNVFSNPTINLGNDTIICPNTVLDWSIVSDANSYLWSNGDTTLLTVITSPGTYWLQGTNSCGNAVDSITISTYNSISLNLGNDTILCSNQQVTLNAYIDSGTYIWQDGSTNQYYTVSNSGLYYVTSSNLCDTLTDSIFVSIMPNAFSLGNDTAICSTTPFLLDVPIGFSSFQWQDGSNDSILYASTSGIYAVQFSNICGTFNDSISIIFNTPISLSLGNDTAICLMDSVLIQAVGTYQNIQWNTGLSSSSIYGYPNQTYTALGTNACGSYTDTIIVSYLPTPIVNLGSDIAVCAQSIANFDVTQPNCTYLWQDGNNNPIYNVSNSGIYWVTINNVCGFASDTINVQLDDTLDIQVCPNPTICVGDSAKIFVIGDYPNLLWSNGSYNDSIWGLSGNIYSVSTQNLCGISTAQISVLEHPKLVVSYPNDTAFCEGQNASLIAYANNYSSSYWENGSSGLYRNVNESGTYKLTVENSCEADSAEIHVEIYDLPYFDLGNDTTICNENSLTFTLPVFDGASYAWSNGSNNKSTVVIFEQELFATIITKNGCEYSDTIYVSDCDLDIWIPNTFTPNRDGVNDKFQIVSSPLPYFEIMIFNRWGELIFTSNSLDYSWDGMYNGKLCPNGVYTYQFRYMKPRETNVNTVRGKVHLLD